MKIDAFDGLMVKVFYDKNGDYLPHLVELPNVSAFGSPPVIALKELKAIGFRKLLIMNEGSNLGYNLAFM